MDFIYVEILINLHFYFIKIEAYMKEMNVEILQCLSTDNICTDNASAIS